VLFWTGPYQANLGAGSPSSVMPQARQESAGDLLRVGTVGLLVVISDPHTGQSRSPLPSRSIVCCPLEAIPVRPMSESTSVPRKILSKSDHSSKGANTNFQKRDQGLSKGASTQTCRTVSECRHPLYPRKLSRLSRLPASALGRNRTSGSGCFG
jgi:hypothetical protein